MTAPTPIREDDPPANRARQALMLAQMHRLLTFRGVYDLSEPDQVEALQAELGAGAELPPDDGTYLLVYRHEPDGTPTATATAALISEEDAPSVAFALAWQRDPQLAAKWFIYRAGVLPAVAAE